jgi:hypothetical protein
VFAYSDVEKISCKIWLTVRRLHSVYYDTETSAVPIETVTDASVIMSTNIEGKREVLSRLHLIYIWRKWFITINTFAQHSTPKQMVTMDTEKRGSVGNVYDLFSRD